MFDELNSSTAAGCVLKNVIKNSGNILINGSSKIRKMEIDFDKCLNIEITETKTIFSHCSLYQSANVKVLITGLTQKKHIYKCLSIADANRFSPR